MKKVFYIECSGDIWRSIASHCAERAGWNPVLWTAAGADESVVKALFPNVEFRRGPDATLNVLDVSWPRPAISSAYLGRLSDFEAIAVQMMDRLDPDGGFTEADRRLHFRELVRTWAGALDHFKPDLVVFSIAPHLVFDYVLYALCRERGVPTVMFERHGLPGWVFTLDEFDKPCGALRRALMEEHPVSLPAPYTKWLSDLSAGAGAAVPPNFRKKLSVYRLASAGAQPSLVRALAIEAKRAILLLRLHGLAGSQHTYLRSSRPPHRRAGWLEATRSRFRGLFKKRRLAKELRRLASQPVAGERYILVALHYQPERSTSPMGGIFGDQHKAIELLCRALPAGWWLYVKEHPWQLQFFGRGEMSRDDTYYARIARYPNVRLISPDADTASLIDSAQAVATIAGSAGWQALCRGIPALVFGDAWYAPCEGAFRVQTEHEARTAIRTIASGARVDRQAVRRFVGALARISVPGVLEPAIESAEGVDQCVAAEAMAEALMAHVRS